MIRETLQIPPGETPDRLDKIISLYSSSLSRRRIKQLISQGSVFVNNRRVRRVSFRVFPPVIIRIHAKSNQDIENKRHQIHWANLLLYRDEQLIILNKPAGIPTAPTADSAVHNVYHYLREENLLPPHFFPFHRLDRDTSGVLLIPLSRPMIRSLNHQMKNRDIGKEYLAVCRGLPSRENWRVEGNISRRNNSSSLMQFASQAEMQNSNSLTEFRVLASRQTPDICCVAARPQTGRTHQIRLHLRYSGLPILGDKQYHPSRTTETVHPQRMLLHCREMSFFHPFLKNHFKIAAPLPEDFRSLLDKFFPELTI